ncbi:hypothetical protein [Empedobacter tilapiae]|uniref:hypothetical protein n=1 Tax=Empedobacter tilapiae TaxID=2491114 RepID=UPI0028D3D88E|nr:hypothetical protein [Empedobacter tilapiae]
MGKEGFKIIQFTVVNASLIQVEGIKYKAILNGIISLMINASDKGNQKKLINGSETPKTIPYWIWVHISLFIGWDILRNYQLCCLKKQYKSIA